MSDYVLNYLAYLFTSILLVLAFLRIYTAVTPIDEFLLIRQGNMAAALSLSGALVGFCLTIVASILHTDAFLMYFTWAAASLVVQLFAYVAARKMLKMTCEHIEAGNVAFGAIVGAMSLSLGAINAACVY